MVQSRTWVNRKAMRLPLALLLLVCVCAPGFTQSQNPFLPPRAKVNYAPDRTFDLLHVKVQIDVDYPKRAIKAVATNTFSPLRNHVAEVMFHAGKALAFESITLDGKPAAYRQDGLNLYISIPPNSKGKTMTATFKYSSNTLTGGTFGGGGGWQWIEPRGNPTRVGFWTQGQTQYNSVWVPTWDYPNDLATSETIVTVDADWTVVGNGALVSDTTQGKRRTFHWRMTQPHATYLLSLCAGPFDIKRSTWEGISLWYVVPKGYGELIDDSFGDTPDMLTFFSTKLGVKYPWPKYAQNAMYDFGGGMENVSSTTLGAGNLTDARQGYRLMAGLNAHELAHQWFGDLVTCKDWGHIWLNESFATYMESCYFEHSRGKNEYEREVAQNSAAYFGEARRYKRPLATKLYPNMDAVFDSHAYPKGAVILHTLRREIGDEAFWKGLNHYLTLYRHQSVESWQLCRAITEATGINVEPFWDQWIYKPGHPVISYRWEWDDSRREILVKVEQTQDTADGTPIYQVQTAIGVIANDKLHRTPVRLLEKNHEFRIPASSRPDAVVFDPDHSFLRELSEPERKSAEWLAIAQYAPNAVLRQRAFEWVANNDPSTRELIALETLAAGDMGRHPVFTTINTLARLKRSERSFWMNQLRHPNFERQAQAVRALADMPEDASTVEAFKKLVNDKTAYAPLLAVLRAFSNWGAAKYEAILVQATKIPSRNGRIAQSAIRSLADANTASAEAAIRASLTYAKGSQAQAEALRVAADKGWKTAEVLAAVDRNLAESDTGSLQAAIRACELLSLKDRIPKLEKLLDRGFPRSVESSVRQAIDALRK